MVDFYIKEQGGDKKKIIRELRQQGFKEVKIGLSDEEFAKKLALEQEEALEEQREAAMERARVAREER